VDLHRHPGNSPGTYETFQGAAQRHFNGTLAGTITVTAGLGGMGGAQPLAVKLAGGVSICVEVDANRIQRSWRRVPRQGHWLARRSDRDGARGEGRRQAMSIGLMGNAAEVLPKMVEIGFTPELVTDQTSAHDPLWGYLRLPRADEDLNVVRAKEPDSLHGACADVDGGARAGHPDHATTRRGRFRLWNNLRTQAQLAGVTDAFAYPGFVPAFIRDSFCEGRGRSAGSRSRAILRTLRRPIRRCSSFSPTTSV